ncbi:MAG: type VI secretion system baseplate subunit TssF [Acidobacteriales bacterium]|nr:type VI secretion system baseplate subunit TssF [Terriglobales bacterium]
MRDDLLLYYERELTFLRQMGAQFAEKYPKIASRLNLEADKCEDPHVERLLEAFAFLAARVHLKIDDEFPEITEALLSIVYPHFLRPIPSMTVVEFQVRAEDAQIGNGLKLPRGSVLSSRPVGGVPCKFRTCYDTMVWPLSVAAAEWKSPDRLQPAIKAADAVAALRVELRCWPEVAFGKLGLRSLRFFLNGESGMVHTLYELLCSRLSRIVVRDPTPGSRVRPINLHPDSLRPVGFGEDEAMLPYPRRSFAGYRLLQEYFAFPDKFFFIDLKGLDALAAAGFKDRAEIVFLISPFELTDRRQALEMGVSAKTMKLGCAPAVNLAGQTAEPIQVSERRFEYPIIPDVRRPNALEIYSVDEVVSLRPGTQDVVRFEPFYSFRHATTRGGGGQTFWMASRRASGKRDDDGTEMFLSLVDLAQRLVEPDADTLTVRLTCTNRDLPSRLPFGNEAGDFELEGGAPVHAIVALRKPTPAVRPPVGRGAFWRLISHLSLNYLSLVEEGREALQEILKLYNFADSAYSLKQIEGITSLNSRKEFARVISESGITFARGTRVDMELDEENFVGGGAYLFASVIEHFLGLYVTINSFSQLGVTTRQRKEALKLWPPRAGRRILL